MKKYLLLLCVLVHNAIAIPAQDSVAPPSAAEMEGDYVIINYKEYDGRKYVADMKSMRIDFMSGHDLKVSGFYIKGSNSFEARYDETTGAFSFDQGLYLFGYEDGLSQYLYLWDEDRGEVMNSPIEYVYDGNGCWSVATPMVLMSGVQGGELSPYYFSQGSEIKKANAVTENVSYVGWGQEQERYEESRPSLIEIDKSKVVIYNLLQADQYGYGCTFEGTFTSNGQVVFAPQLIGQRNDGTYKVLAGCTYDDRLNKPLDVSDAGGRSEGMVKGRIDFDNGIIEIEPMAIWVGENRGGAVYIAANRSYYEFVKSVKIKFDAGASGAVETIAQDGMSREVTGVEYFDLSGRRLSEPAENSICIKRTYFRHHQPMTEKVLFKCGR